MSFTLLRLGRIYARLLPADDAGRAMSNPDNSGDLDEMRKLLDRLAAVDPKCLPDIIVGEWLNADPGARRKIEEEIDLLLKEKKSN